MQPKSQVDYGWLIKSVSFYQNLGFFNQWPQTWIDSLIADLVDELKDTHFSSMAHEAQANVPGVDRLLLRNDSARVWWEDTEADVAPGREVYRSTIQEWARISRDALVPTDVHETWVTETGPVYVTFSLFGQPVKIRARYLDDYIDTDILKPINKLLLDTGFQFKVYEVFDQTAFIIMLKPDEIELLQSERSWRFQPDISRFPMPRIDGKGPV